MEVNVVSTGAQVIPGVKPLPPQKGMFGIFGEWCAAYTDELQT